MKTEGENVSWSHGHNRRKIYINRLSSRFKELLERVCNNQKIAANSQQSKIQELSIRSSS
jgi:hypothetical protein